MAGKRNYGCKNGTILNINFYKLEYPLNCIKLILVTLIHTSLLLSHKKYGAKAYFISILYPLTEVRGNG